MASTSFQLTSSSVLRGLGSILDLTGAPVRRLASRTPTATSKRALRADVQVVSADARAALAQTAPNLEDPDG